ncbi:hypothetical protein EJ08DRAFT_691154 [Tothia fuscella]|uniref:Uncharacterized protein n=1 Tax=Tothia fuscella TaxID=1048955 RepID=A0A9P4U582_9PEZI|nr:hypothetical protein EJ08DRAFT_691154 [Tothia fuscella]
MGKGGPGAWPNVFPHVTALRNIKEAYDKGEYGKDEQAEKIAGWLEVAYSWATKEHEYFDEDVMPPIEHDWKQVGHTVQVGEGEARRSVVLQMGLKQIMEEYRTIRQEIGDDFPPKPNADDLGTPAGRSYTMGLAIGVIYILMIFPSQPTLPNQAMRGNKPTWRRALLLRDFWVKKLT